MKESNEMAAPDRSSRWLIVVGIFAVLFYISISSVIYSFLSQKGSWLSDEVIMTSLAALLGCTFLFSKKQTIQKDRSRQSDQAWRQAYCWYHRKKTLDFVLADFNQLPNIISPTYSPFDQKVLIDDDFEQVISSGITSEFITELEKTYKVTKTLFETYRTNCQQLEKTDPVRWLTIIDLQRIISQQEEEYRQLNQYQQLTSWFDLLAFEQFVLDSDHQANEYFKQQKAFLIVNYLMLLTLPEDDSLYDYCNRRSKEFTLLIDQMKKTCRHKYPLEIRLLAKTMAHSRTLLPGVMLGDLITELTLQNASPIVGITQTLLSDLQRNHLKQIVALFCGFSDLVMTSSWLSSSYQGLELVTKSMMPYVFVIMPINRINQLAHQSKLQWLIGLYVRWLFCYVYLKEHQFSMTAGYTLATLGSTLFSSYVQPAFEKQGSSEWTKLLSYLMHIISYLYLHEKATTYFDQWVFSKSSNSMSDTEALQLFGLSRSNCTTKNIKSSYHKLALKHHPDKNPFNQKDSQVMMTRLNEARQILTSSVCSM